MPFENPAASPAYPVPRHPRFLLLDAWRGLACLMIVVGHAIHGIQPDDWEHLGSSPPMRLLNFAVRQLYLGVPLFFVISGYCISATVDSTRQKGRGCATYFRRRFRRIFPPYWIFLGLVLALSLGAAWVGFQYLLTPSDPRFDCFIPAPESLTWANWLGSLTLTEGWRWHLTADPPRSFFGPAWTLCYEEQFYAVCGLLLWLAARRFWQGVIVVTLLTLPTTILSFLPDYQQSLAGFFCDGRWLVFAAGILVYYHVNHADAGQRRNLWVFLLLATLACLFLRFQLLNEADPEMKTLAFEILVAGLFAVLLIVQHPWDERLASLAILRPLRFCGQICYSLYLVHYPVTILVSHIALEAGVTDVWPTLLIVAPLGTGLSLLFSWLFYLAVENRFMNPPVRAKALEVAGA